MERDIYHTLAGAFRDKPEPLSKGTRKSQPLAEGRASQPQQQLEALDVILWKAPKNKERSKEVPS